MLEHPLLTPDHRLSPLEAYLDLLARANWKCSQVELGRRTVTIEPGQLLCSAGSLATRWKWPKTTVQRFLEALHAGRLAGRVNEGEASVLTLYPDGDMPQSELVVTRSTPTDKAVLDVPASAESRVDHRAHPEEFLENSPVPETDSQNNSSDGAPETCSEERATAPRKPPSPATPAKPAKHPLFDSEQFAQFVKETMESAHPPSLFDGSLVDGLRRRYVEVLRDSGKWEAVLAIFPELSPLYPPPVLELEVL
ncbi:hypothetical protein HZB60_07190 [candidate division KSB1 bacterium]|nr:hypothetical protein [candidate division KSB1 bacterium]